MGTLHYKAPVVRMLRMMRIGVVKCEGGVILRVKDFGEADRILTILSDTDGKFDAVARGARRPRSRLVGGLLNNFRA